MKKNIEKLDIINYEEKLKTSSENLRKNPQNSIESLLKLYNEIKIFFDENSHPYKDLITLFLKINYQLIVAYFFISNFNEAIKYIDNIKNLYLKFDLKKDLIFYKSLMAHGIIISEIGDPIEGINIFKSLLKKIKFSELKLYLFNNIAESYNSLQIYNKALYYYKKALEISNDYNDKGKHIIIIQNISSLYIKLENYKKAKIYTLKGLNLLKNYLDDSTKSLFYKNLALIKLSENNIEKAFICIKKGISLSKKISKWENYIQCLLVKLNIYEKLLDTNNIVNKEKYEENLKKFKKLTYITYKKIKEKNLLRFLPQLFLTNAKIYEKLKDYELSFIYYKKYINFDMKLKKEGLEKDKDIKEKNIAILKELKEKELYYLKYNKLKKLNQKLKTLHIKRKNEIKIVNKIYNNLILPEIPFIPGIHIYTNFKAGKNLSGDFYFYNIFSPTKIGIFIADICGHGIYPSFCTILLKMFFNTYYIKIDPSSDLDEIIKPQKVIEKINNFLIKTIKLDNYVTAFYCIIDLDKRIIFYTSAGHTPQIFFIDGNIQILKPNSPFIGLKENINFNSDFIKFNENSCLLLFTDGIIEYKLKDGNFFNINSLINYFFSDKDTILNNTEKNFNLKKEIDVNEIKNKTENIFSYLENLSLETKKYKNLINTKQIEKDDSTIISIIFK